MEVLLQKFNMPSDCSTLVRGLLPVFLIYGGIRLFFWWVAFPNPDEAYYWLWGQHLAWSYYDHPPLIAWIQALFTGLFGRSTVVLRLPNLLTNGLLFYLYYRICRYLYGPAAVKYWGVTIAILLASPLYFLFLGLAWPDHLLMLLIITGCFSLITFLDRYSQNKRGESWRLYGAALALGLAWLAKYNASFVVLGVLMVLLKNQQYRPLLRDRRLYLATAIVILSLAPILIWNLSNQFQSLQYYATRSVNGGGQILKPGEFLGFIALSIVMFSPVNSYVLLRLLRRPERWVNPTSAYWQVALSVFWASTGILLILSFFSTALYYWNIAAYLLMLPLLSAFFLRPARMGDAVGLAAPLLPPADNKIFSKPRLFWGGQVYGLLFALLLGIHYAIVPISAWFSADGDPDSRMLYGWPQVAAAVTLAKQNFSQPPVLVTTDYRSASALAYELNDRSVIAVSDRVDQFDFWFDDSKPPKQWRDRSFQGRDAIILSDDWHPLSPELRQQFNLSPPITVPIRRWNWWIKNYYIFRAKNRDDKTDS